MFLVPVQPHALCNAACHGDRSAAVPADEAVVFRFVWLRETGDAVFLPQGRKSFQPSGQNLMGIALMPYVPDEFIFRRIKHTVHRHRQFHRPQIGSEMPAGFGNSFYEKTSNLRTECGTLFRRKCLQIVRRVQTLQQVLLCFRNFHIFHGFVFCGSFAGGTFRGSSAGFTPSIIFHGTAVPVSDPAGIHAAGTGTGSVLPLPSVLLHVSWQLPAPAE